MKGLVPTIFLCLVVGMLLPALIRVGGAVITAMSSSTLGMVFGGVLLLIFLIAITRTS